VRIGTRAADVIGFCGGMNPKRKIGRIVIGGSMTGRVITDLDTPTDKSTEALLCLSENESAPHTENYACIRCGRCVDVCPMGLMPLYIAGGKCRDDAAVCTECGACAYVCPGRVPLVGMIRNARMSDGTVKAEEATNKKGFDLTSLLGSLGIRGNGKAGKKENDPKNEETADDTPVEITTEPVSEPLSDNTPTETADEPLSDNTPVTDDTEKKEDDINE